MCLPLKEFDELCVFGVSSAIAIGVEFDVIEEGKEVELVDKFGEVDDGVDECYGGLTVMDGVVMGDDPAGSLCDPLLEGEGAGVRGDVLLVLE